MLAFILSPVGRYLAGAVAVVVLLGGAYALGAKSARQSAREQALIDYAATMERIAREDDIDLSDDAAVRERLCALAGLRKCPVQSDGGQSEGARSGPH